MQSKLLARVIRFGLVLLAAWLFLRVMPSLLPGHPMTAAPGAPVPGPNTDMSLSLFAKRPVATMIGESAPNTLLTFAKALAYALLPGVALGLLTGAKPGSLLDRILHAPVLVLTAMPAFLPALAGIYLLSLEARIASIPGGGLAGLAVVFGAWLARSVREGALTAGSEHGLNYGQAILTGLGRLLQQFGNLLAAVLLVEVAAAIPGLGRLLFDGMMMRDYPVVFGVLPVLIFSTLAVHLAGDLLVTATVRQERQTTRPSTGWLIAGGVLTAFLLVAAVASFSSPEAIDIAQKLHPPGTGHLLGTDNMGRDVLQRLAAGTRTSLAIAFAATLIAAVGGALLGVLGGLTGKVGSELFAPRVTLPAALWPIVIGLPVILATRPSLPLLIIITGITAIPAFAYPVRRLITAGRTGQPAQAATLALVGTLALLLAQGLLVEAYLSYIGLGVMPPTPSLGNTIASAMRYLRQAPFTLVPAATVSALGLGGLFLMGQSLTEAAGHEAGD